MTRNRFNGVLTGVGVTALIQSSSATTVMVVSFVNAGLMTLRQAIGVIMGANFAAKIQKINDIRKKNHSKLHKIAYFHFLNCIK